MLAQDLPVELRTWLLMGGDKAQGFDVNEFLRRVADREDVDPDTATEHAQAVFAALARLVRGDEMAKLAAQLPGEYRKRLVGEAAKRRRDPGAPAAALGDVFVERIADREGVSYEQALEQARAVFAALRDTLTDREFSDLLAELPKGYHEALL